TVAGKRPARPLRPWSPGAICAEPASTQCASAARTVFRKRSRPCEEAAASASRLATPRRCPWVRKPPGTRLRFFVSCKTIREIYLTGCKVALPPVAVTQTPNLCRPGLGYERLSRCHPHFHAIPNRRPTEVIARKKQPRYVAL